MTFSINVHSQQLEGLGFLKIGRSESLIIDSLKSTGFKLYKAISLAHENTMYIKKTSILKYEQPKKGGYDNAPLVNGHSKYLILGLNIGSIEIPEVEVHFLDDILIGITVGSSLKNKISIYELKSAFITKFGAPNTVLMRKEEINCYSASTGDFKTESFTKNYYFREDDKIKAYFSLNVNYDLNCRLSQTEYLQFETESYIRLLKEEERLKLEKSGKKVNLNDF